MAFTEINGADADQTISLGGYNKKLKRENPTQIEGYYVGSKQIVDKLNNRPGNLYILQTPKGNVGVWGKTDMDRKMSAVELGCMIRISYTGDKPTPKGDMKLFKVEVDRANTVEVSQTFSPTASTPSTEVAQDYDDTGFIEQDSPLDEVQAAPARKPATPAPAADAARKAKVQALLKR